VNEYIINVTERASFLSVSVEDYDGIVLASVHAPIVEGSTFDTKGAAVLKAVSEAIENQKQGLDEW
jgi:hypothetical protein